MFRYSLLFTALCFFPSAHAGTWNSSIAGEWMVFSEDAAFAAQEESYLSAALETEFFHKWNNGDDLFVFKPFYRIDQHDAERTHGDIRELFWNRASNDWELLVGISKVYWGATEAAHLVDIINQTDFVENVDGEDKLGQPMLKFSLIKDWGVADLFVLPGFRERTFPDVNGRPRFGSALGAVIDSGSPQYESSSKEKHIDYALRWSDTLGDWDVGLSYFKGTSREPLFVPGGAGLVPRYDLIGQVGLDVQGIVESWLFKVEAITRSGQGDAFNAAATGIEYTIVGVNESQVDVGVIAEYLYDERINAIFQNDIVVGARIVLNDADSSELLISAIIDLEGDGQNFNIEGATRLSGNMKISIEARGVTNLDSSSPLVIFEKDNRIRTELTYYF